MISIFFILKCSEWQKFSQEKQVKTFVQNFLSFKSADFTWINKLSNILQELIQNNGEYTINWN